ncbi:MAG: serine/threonine protein kinase [Kofleriaceae bacterium]|nr:serine/threonine protein kinase [Myxococcales bacterium]MCB9559865.1 serine/threonine protein kinase [Kofleriaceae bacterium]MCB9571477.1 serine/threonine protein kinase [Kofleriaceae bacterium]
MKPADRAGQLVAGRYQLVRLIGRGAMADVYRAVDQGGGGGGVAVKILRQSLRSDPEAVARFEREAQAQGLVRHRNVAALYGGGVTDAGEPFLVLELLRGKSLRTVVKTEGRVSARRAASYTWQALQGLGAVHATGILHRDLKPANLMLEPSEGPIERVVVIDFGFAALEGSSKLTQQGHVVGSLTYMAPERLRGEPGDERSDLYAMGVIFYELVCGAAPFAGGDDFELVNQHLTVTPPPVRELHPEAVDVTPALEAVAQRALAKHPGERYASAAAMAQAIEDAARSLVG